MAPYEKQLPRAKRIHADREVRIPGICRIAPSGMRGQTADNVARRSVAQLIIITSQITALVPGRVGSVVLYHQCRSWQAARVAPIELFPSEAVTAHYGVCHSKCPTFSQCRHRRRVDGYACK